MGARRAGNLKASEACLSAREPKFDLRNCGDYVGIMGKIETIIMGL